MKRILFETANFLLFPIVKTYWFLFSPKRTGVKVLIKHNDSVLFVQHSYGGKNWTLPGGGVKKGERLEDAAKREVREETGIECDVILKGSFPYNGEGKQDTIHVFFAEVSEDTFYINNWEIKNACWRRINDMTLNKSPVSKKCFEVVGYTL